MYRILALLSMALCTIALFTQSLYSQSSVCHDNNFGVDGCYGPFTGMTAVGTTTTFNQAANNSQGSIPVSNYPISLYTGGKPALAHFLPWFQVTSSDQSAPSFPIVSGNGYKAANGHVEIGYDSSQSTLINNQLRDIYQRGFSGVVVDWYGPFNAQGITRFEDTVTKNVNSAMVTQTGYCVTNLLCNLTFGIMEDQGAWLGVYPMGSGYTATAACSKNASDNTSCISTHIVNDIQSLLSG